MTDWSNTILTLFGAFFTVILALIGWIMSGIRKDLKDLWKAVTELNNTLLKDYATKVQVLLLDKDLSGLARNVHELDKEVALMKQDHK